MISATFPGFLVAGAVFAAIPVGLHFLARRPPARAALPTARFLSPDARTLLRLRRTPTDLLLLAVRVAFALALAGAFAGLRWLPERSGTARVVLVDAGADERVPWDAVVSAARGSSGALSSDATTLVASFLAYGLDDGPRLVDGDGLAQLARGTRPATLEDGLRALRDVAADGRFATASVSWAGRPSWRVWSDGLGLMREALWPGRIDIRPLSPVGDTAGTEAATPPEQIVAWVSDGPEQEALRRAVEALGARVVSSQPAGAGAGGPSPDWIVLDGSTGIAAGPLLDHARAGATVILSGPLPSDAQDLPWSADTERGGTGDRAEATSSATRPTDPNTATLLLPGDVPVGAPVTRLPGAPAPDARTIAVFDDATPAAAARPVGDGCAVYLASSLSAPELATSPEYPTLIRTLSEGCVDLGAADGSLDRGALLALERPDLPATVDVGALFASDGIPLTRWLLFLAMILLAAEVAMTWERRA